MTNAVFTLLYHPNYLPGALVLGIVLKKLLEIDPIEATTGILIDKSQFNDYQILLLSRYYSELIDVAPTKSELKDKLHNDLGRPELDKTYTKIELWNLLHHDRILYLDCDTLPTIPKDPIDQGTILNLLKLDFPTGKIMAAPDSGYPDIFNSGVFALKPNTVDYENLVAASKLPDASFDGADQGLLNQYFNNENDWIKALIELLVDKTSTVQSTTTQLANWIRIPFLYNVTPSTQYEYLPAYKYFTGDETIGGDLEKPFVPTKDKLISPKFKKPSKDQLAESTSQTKGNYAKTAFEYINVTDKVKLVHFIGPYKPWKVNCTTEGLYQDWWNLWFDEFGHRSIVEVINEVAKAAAEVEGVELDQEEGGVSSSGPVVAEIKDVRIDPYDVLNPDNYQHIPDLPRSRDAAWDATKEAPPGAVTITCDKASTKTSEDQVLQTTDFSQIKQFVNAWDASDEVALHRDDSASVNNAEIAKESPGSGSWWSHADSKPAERVFYNEFDYNPSHILKPVSKVEVEESTEPSEPKGPAELNDEMVNLTEKLNKTGVFEDDSGFDEIYHENQTPTASDLEENNHQEAEEEEEQPPIPKIFPWEHRKYKAERSFN
ncbi:uncharacterized protein KQ657_003334 [Scheffersomyces spartinae]|uniref:Glycogenin glucosyltransferase n=1 Tax=Scheffersomyces spartinae TaxID=45513 RepID=A0A9P7VD76_9ASCO|nr:uncharacterized protein KQ657_003334 [Scheffersomyces spartinae]KAG7195567.1 hypothetical protein KQ657_003334 [Scheffersomyces spartinae]